MTIEISTGRGLPTTALPRARKPREVATGLVFLAFAAAFGLVSLEHRIGTAFRMGPGYFPLVLAVLLALIGAVTLVDGLRPPRAEPIEPGRTAAIILIPGSVLLFAATLQGLGLVIAVALAVLTSAAASRAFDPRSATALAVGLAIFAWAVFVRLLGLPIPVLGRWLGG